MKARTLVLMGLALGPYACGVAEPNPNSLPATAINDSLWPETEIPKGQGATNGDEENPWLGGLGARFSGAGGGTSSSVSSGGTSLTTPEKPEKSEPEETSGGGMRSTSPGEPERARPELLFTRYDESTGSEKRLKIENLGRGIAADECALSIFSNGNTKPFRTLSLGALDEAASVRLCTTQVSDESCTGSLGSSSFNGNDALVLSCQSEIIDSLGRVGEDPGRGWSDGSVRTWDATLVRCGRSPDTDPTDPVLLGRSWALGPFEVETTEDLCPPAFGLGGASTRE